MTRAKVLVGLTTLIGAFSVFVVPAFANFESQNGSSNQGKGELTKAKLDLSKNGKGELITCETHEEPSNVGWTVEDEQGKAQKKGPNLQIKVINWGKCQTKAFGFKETEVKMSGCSMETKQKGKQAKVPISFTSRCEIRFILCTVTIEPSNNLGLEELELQSNGKAHENTGVGLNISSITTRISSGCVGFKGISETARLLGLAQLDRVKTDA